MYRERGLSVIPLLSGGKKPAIESWLPYQSKIASAEQIIEWFSGQDYNLGIITGEISDLTVVD